MQDRNLGERNHSTLQAALAVVFHQNRNSWNLLPLPEQRVQITDTRFRVSDLCIVRREDPRDQIVLTALPLSYALKSCRRGHPEPTPGARRRLVRLWSRTHLGHRSVNPPCLRGRSCGLYRSRFRCIRSAGNPNSSFYLRVVRELGRGPRTVVQFRPAHPGCSSTQVAA